MDPWLNRGAGWGSASQWYSQGGKRLLTEERGSASPEDDGSGYQDESGYPGDSCSAFNGDYTLTAKDLGQIVPNAGKQKVRLYASLLNDAFKEFGIKTIKQKQAFIAQVAHESNAFTATVERLSYSSAERILATWPKRFKTLNAAKPYVKNPKGLANFVYGGRLGNTKPGDGYLYRGRGLIQLTGRKNYLDAAKDLGLDIINKPDLLSDPKNATRVSAWFWKKKGLNKLADRGNFKGISKAINGGLNGYEDRLKYYRKAKQVLSCSSDSAKRLTSIKQLELSSQPLERATKGIKELKGNSNSLANDRSISDVDIITGQWAWKDTTSGVWELNRTHANRSEPLTKGFFQYSKSNRKQPMVKGKIFLDSDQDGIFNGDSDQRIGRFKILGEQIKSADASPSSFSANTLTNKLSIFDDATVIGKGVFFNANKIFGHETI